MYRMASLACHERAQLVATADRQGLSALDIVAVLTKVVQEQQKVVAEQQKVVRDQRVTIADLQARLARLEGLMASMSANSAR